MLKVVDGVLGDTSEDLLKNASKYTGTPNRYVCTYVCVCSAVHSLMKSGHILKRVYVYILYIVVSFLVVQVLV